MYDMPKNCPYTVKSVRIFRGMEGYGYNADIYLNGRKVIRAIDDATGGEVMLEEVVPGAIKALKEYATQLPPYPAEPKKGMLEPLAMDSCCFVGELVKLAEATKVREKNTKKFAKACQTQMLFRTDKCAKGSWLTLRLPAGVSMAQGREAMKKEYGKIVVLNDLLAVDPYAWERF
jgi:hypothetical protein